MTRDRSKQRFAARPATPDEWVRDSNRSAERDRAATAYTARLTVDITPELRGRIKIEAFQRGVTVADMLRALLVEEFSDRDGEAK
ncbi:hypothetical protein A9995_14995 [Erythrobacter sp. QSSC1-22B]|uniref:ribbon-helix-helix protein n=1 Tax=Erythrobacter sp. QSSC1-22B TaxID=1860125 RepID=UPI000805C48A|nr:hypothetical protein [Erythrobacter sp. QSSC1-22B]OBX17692.1 hypothetical protein A9995_14995 [Erythrobacter sp. QSSC1-22B]